ncbi:MAG: pilus assembly protein N-terminal domain-containing protein [Pirellulaceae bacterium]
MLKQTSTASLAVYLTVLIAGSIGYCGPLRGQDEAPPAVPASSRSSAAGVTYRVTQPTQRLEMIVNSSSILTLEKVVPRFQVQNEEILIANPVAPNQVQISAQAPGVTQLNLWDVDDTLYTVDVIITGDARELSTVLQAQFPFATLRVTPLPTGAVIDGMVTDTDDIDRVIAVAQQFYPNVVNNIKVVGVQTILLHTKIMEVSRSKVRELGLDWGATNSSNLFALGVNGMINVPGSSVTNIVPSGTPNARVGLIRNGDVLDVLIRALQQNNCAKILAEPTIVATHGRPSRFIVGGRFPIVSPNGNGGSVVTFEEFGTSVDFLPFLVGPGRVRLEIRPEVSERDDANGISLNGFTVPALRQRYVETAVEMQAGQTYAIAGLLQNRTETITSGPPFLVSLPWIGTLFRRVESAENEIELLVTVTPELADAMDPHQVPPGGPGTHTTVPSDKELYFKGYVEVPRVTCSATDGCMMEPGIGSPMYEQPEMPVYQNVPVQQREIYSAPMP